MNFFDEDVKRDPYPHYAALRATGPVVQHPFLLSMWLVVGFDEVLAVLNDPTTFSSAGLGAAQQAGVLPAATMLTSDPPDHERLRSVVAKAFTPRSVAALEPRVRAVVRQMLQPLADGGPFELVSGLSSPLPALMIAELLGVAAADIPEFVAWSAAIIAAVNPLTGAAAQSEATAASVSLQAYFAREAGRRRATPADDLVGRIVVANDDGRLSEVEMLASCVLLLLGGNETTTNLITNTALALARHPDERKRVVADPALLPTAIEETLRYDPPVQGNARVTTRDVDLAGQTIPQGALITALLAAANRDPARFDDPDRFDVGRDPNPHLSFSRGIHFCLGASLARLEARIAIEELLRVAPDYALTNPDAPLTYGPVFFFHSPTELAITR